LIDSILKDIDIPKLYFNLTTDGTYEVVDGQQRLWAIWDFLDDLYPYSHGGPSRKFTGLQEGEPERIKQYMLQVTILQDADDEYLRQLFVRLQLGLLLITGEKLHAAVGAMKDLVFGGLVGHPFVQGLGMPARRYAKETLCAQICINSFTRKKLGVFARTRYEDLETFFNEYEQPQGADRELFEERAGVIRGVLDRLHQMFQTKAGALRNRSYILSVYLLAEELVQGNSLPAADEAMFVEFVLSLWDQLRREIGAGFDRRNRELYSFQTFVSSAPGEKYQIERRHAKLREYYDYFKVTRKIKGDVSQTP